MSFATDMQSIDYSDIMPIKLYNNKGVVIIYGEEGLVNRRGWQTKFYPLK
jgi:hypothetical protein